jgi:ERCC4-related helicase
LRNRNIANFIAKLANAEAKVFGRQTLVLVDETSQIAMLAPLLTAPYAIAHSETKKERLGELGISKVDTAESVDQFNRNEAKVLIGTSCIATGTNIYPCHNTMNWQGGSSEVKTRQGAVGRSVRFGHQNPYANKCQPKPRSIIWDFDVRGNETLSRHLDQRIEYYEQSGAEIKRIKLR